MRVIVHVPLAPKIVSVHWPDPLLPWITPLKFTSIPAALPVKPREPVAVIEPDPERVLPSIELRQLTDTPAWVAFPAVMLTVQVPVSSPA